MQRILFIVLIFFFSGLIQGPLFKFGAQLLTDQLPQNASFEDFCERGIRRLDRRDYRAAIEDFNKSIRLNRNHGRAYNNRALAEEQLSDFKGALADYTEAIRLRYWTATYNRASLRSRMGDREGAIEDLSRCIDLKIFLLESYACRGWERECLGQVPEAYQDYRLLLSLNPVNAHQCGNHAWVYAHLKDYDAAISDYSQAIRFNPGCAEYYRRRAESKMSIDDGLGATIDFASAKILECL